MTAALKYLPDSFADRLQRKARKASPPKRKVDSSCKRPNQQAIAIDELSRAERKELEELLEAEIARI